MNTVEFLKYLDSMDVKLWVHEKRLYCDGPEKIMTDVLRKEIDEVARYHVVGELVFEIISEVCDIGFSVRVFGY